MSIDTQERLERRAEELAANDPQFAAARPDEAVSAAIQDAGSRLPQVIKAVLEGYPTGRRWLNAPSSWSRTRRPAARRPSCSPGSTPSAMASSPPGPT